MNVMDSAITVVLISMNETSICSMIGVMKSNDKTLYGIEQLGEDKLLLLNMTSYKIYFIISNNYRNVNQKSVGGY